MGASADGADCGAVDQLGGNQGGPVAMFTHNLGTIAAASVVMAATFAACDRSESPASPVAGSCATTIPSQPGFQPSDPWPATFPEEERVWYGTQELWTFLDIDGDSPLLIEEEAPGTNAHTDDHGWAMMNGIDPEDPGCWEVTATYRGATLSYVYEYP